MQYVGGKQKSGGQHIARILNESCPQGGTIYEPMCGGLSVTYRLKHPVIASDACVHLMALHRAVQEGWEPPEVSKDLWLECKERAERSYADPLVGFMGYGCSYTGSWFGSYASGDAPSTITYPADEQWGTIDSFALPGNWMIRGIASTSVANHCASGDLSWVSVWQSSGSSSAGGSSQGAGRRPAWLGGLCGSDGAGL